MTDDADSFFTIESDESSGNGDGRVLAYQTESKSRRLMARNMRGESP